MGQGEGQGQNGNESVQEDANVKAIGKVTFQLRQNVVLGWSDSVTCFECEDALEKFEEKVQGVWVCT